MKTSDELFEEALNAESADWEKEFEKEWAKFDVHEASSPLPVVLFGLLVMALIVVVAVVVVLFWSNSPTRYIQNEKGWYADCDQWLWHETEYTDKYLIREMTNEEYQHYCGQ